MTLLYLVKNSMSCASDPSFYTSHWQIWHGFENKRSVAVSSSKIWGSTKVPVWSQWVLHTWVMWGPSSSSIGKQTASKSYCLFAIQMQILLKKQIHHLKFMRKQRSDWGLGLCFPLPGFHLDNSSLMSGHSISFPHIFLLAFSSWDFSSSVPYGLSLAQTHPLFPCIIHSSSECHLLLKASCKSIAILREIWMSRELRSYTRGQNPFSVILHHYKEPCIERTKEFLAAVWS